MWYCAAQNQSFCPGYRALRVKNGELIVHPSLSATLTQTFPSLLLIFPTDPLPTTQHPATHTTALRGTNSVTYQRQTHTGIRSWKSEFGDITLMAEEGVLGATEAVT